MQRLLFIFLVFCSALLLPSTIYAADTALAVAPAILETVLETKTTQTELTLFNQTNFPLPIKASVVPFLSSELVDANHAPSFDSSSWFKLEPTDFILQPNEVKPIKVKITPPKDAEPGGHYATVLFTPLIPEEAISSAAMSIARVGVLAFLVVPGNVQENLVLEAFSPHSFQTFGPTTFTLTLKNTGSLHLLPQITLEISDLFNRPVATLSAPTSTILPGTSKSYSLTWPRRLGLGPYSLQARVQYGTNQSPLLSDGVTYWLLPWPLFLVIVVLLTLLYKLFIVNGKRVKLAFRVLTGKYDQTQISDPQTNPRHGSRPHPQPNPLRLRPQRRSRRESHRQ